MAGCGGSPQPAPQETAKRPRSSKRPRPAARKERRNPAAGRASPRKDAAALAASSDAPAEAGLSQAPEQQRKPRRSLADLLEQPADSVPRWVNNLRPMQIDDVRVAAAGIRKLSSKRLTLYTDLPPAEEIERLPAVFDQAFPQWCEYFDVDAAQHTDWRMLGCLMKEGARFQRAGLLPGSLPAFQNGFARNRELWLYDQPSDYYRRCLLLHEGTHGFMNSMLGGCGPPWYMEGTAELLSTHRWHNGRLTLNHLPASREEATYWGRIRIIKDAFARQRAIRLEDVIDYSPGAYLETEAYAWSWATAALLDRHPRYRPQFRQLYGHVLQPGFTARFRRLIGDDWQRLSEEWQLMMATLEYGHDVARAAVDFTPGQPLPAEGTTVTVAADRGWQNSGLRLQGGVEYVLRASGRYQVADQPQIWWCEPNGVSIRYYRGRPLGILLGAVRPDEPTADGTSALLRPVVVGLETTLTPEQSGTLYLRINDSAAEWSDNAGELKVDIASG